MEEIYQLNQFKEKIKRTAYTFSVGGFKAEYYHSSWIGKVSILKKRRDLAYF